MKRSTLLVVGIAAVALGLIIGFKPLGRALGKWGMKNGEVSHMVAQEKSISEITMERWGKQTISLADRAAAAERISQLLRIDADAEGGAGLTNGLKSEIVRFVQAYADGSFEAIRDFYVSSNSLVVSNAVMNRLRWHRKNPPSIGKLGEFRVTTPERLAELQAEERAPLVFVPYDSDWEMNLRELYTNMLKSTLGRHVSMEGYRAGKSSWFGKTDRVQAHNDDVRAAMDRSTNMQEFTVPWESLSLDLLQVRVFAGSAKDFADIFRENMALLEGLQFNKPNWAAYEVMPDQVCQRDGHVWYGVFRTAVKPKGDPFYCPVTVCFFYNPQDGQWRVCSVACHSFLSQSMPL